MNVSGSAVPTPNRKRAIVLAVLEDVREFQDRFAHLRLTDPLERLFADAPLAA